MSVLVVDQLGKEELHAALLHALGGDEVVLRIPEGDLRVSPATVPPNEKWFEVDENLLHKLGEAEESEVPNLLSALHESAKPYVPSAS